MSEFLSFPSPAKLNLFLHVVGQRSDGYHELETLFQFLDYSDTIDIAITDDAKITLLTPIDGVDNNDNLIVKAAQLLQQASGTLHGANIAINKVLPMGGGLGGGSSNAATVLLALNTLWQINFSTKKLAAIGLSLGADVPIFIHGFSAFAQGIGEQLIAVSPVECWYLVTKPNCSISTASVFSSTDLPRNTAKLDDSFINKLKLKPSLEQNDIDNCHNDCQIMVTKHYPEVAKLLAWLVEYAPSRMTGTGACVFSRFASKKAAIEVQKKLPNGISSFVAQGLNQSPLIPLIASLKENLNN